MSGGTTLLNMADLKQIRLRALVNETDIGNVKPGQGATVAVDAYPDRQFRGTVEKVEPVAQVDQSVTMFPVLVSISNEDGLLMPGMNGEVTILVQEQDDVLAVPVDAIRTTREAAEAGAALGLKPEDIRSQLKAQAQTRLASAGGSGAAADPAAAGAATSLRPARKGNGAAGRRGQRLYGGAGVAPRGQHCGEAGGGVERDAAALAGGIRPWPEEAAAPAVDAAALQVPAAAEVVAGARPASRS